MALEPYLDKRLLKKKVTYQRSEDILMEMRLVVRDEVEAVDVMTFQEDFLDAAVDVEVVDDEVMMAKQSNVELARVSLSLFSPMPRFCAYRR